MAKHKNRIESPVREISFNRTVSPGVPIFPLGLGSIQEWPPPGLTVAHKGPEAGDRVPDGAERPERCVRGHGKMAARGARARVFPRP